MIKIHWFLFAHLPSKFGSLLDWSDNVRTARKLYKVARYVYFRYSRYTAAHYCSSRWNWQMGIESCGFGLLWRIGWGILRSLTSIRTLRLLQIYISRSWYPPIKRLESTATSRSTGHVPVEVYMQVMANIQSEQASLVEIGKKKTSRVSFHTLSNPRSSSLFPTTWGHERYFQLLIDVQYAIEVTLL